MQNSEQIVRNLEDFILAEHGLQEVGRIAFEHEGQTEHGYPYIRSSNESFAAAIEACLNLLDKPADEIRFLEVGCGIGTKCEIARLLGMQSYGFDLKQEYIDLARKVFPDCNFSQANALEFDYSPYDMVFYHVPFFGDELVGQLETRVLSQLRAGGVLIATRLSEALQKSLAQQSFAVDELCARLIRVDAHIGRLSILRKVNHPPPHSSPPE